MPFFAPKSDSQANKSVEVQTLIWDTHIFRMRKVGNQVSSICEEIKLKVSHTGTHTYTHMHTQIHTSSPPHTHIHINLKTHRGASL